MPIGIIQGKALIDASIPSGKLNTGAKQEVLQLRKRHRPFGVLAVTAPTVGTSTFTFDSSISPSTGPSEVPSIGGLIISDNETTNAYANVSLTNTQGESILDSGNNPVWARAISKTSIAGTATGTALSFDVVITTGNNDQIKLTIDGGTQTEITIAGATYTTIGDLVTAIQAGIDATALIGTVTVTNATGALKFTSATTGSLSTVLISAGTNDARSTLNLSSPTYVNGTNRYTCNVYNDTDRTKQTASLTPHNWTVSYPSSINTFPYRRYDIDSEPVVSDAEYTTNAAIQRDAETVHDITQLYTKSGIVEDTQNTYTDPHYIVNGDALLSAVNKVDTAAYNHVQSTTAHTAANIVNVPSGNLTAITVQAALNELQADIDSTSSGGAPKGATYLVNSADSTLTNEVVVSSLIANLDIKGNLAAARTITFGATDSNYTDLVNVAGQFQLSGNNVTSSADELNKLDGADSNVTATNLNALVGGSDTSLHKHDNMYYTETELNSTSGTSGAQLIGIKDSAGTFDATNVETALAELQTDITSLDSSLTTHINDTSDPHGSTMSVTVQVTTPKVFNAGDFTIDAKDSTQTSTVYIQNSDTTYAANLNIDGGLSFGGTAFTATVTELNQLADGIDSNATATNINALVDGNNTSLHKHALVDGASDVTSSADELNKLDGTDSNVTATNLNALVSGNSTTLHAHASADSSTAGFMSASDKIKLNGISTGATAVVVEEYLGAGTSTTGSDGTQDFALSVAPFDSTGTGVSVKAGTFNVTKGIHWTFVAPQTIRFTDPYRPLADDGNGNAEGVYATFRKA